VVEIVIGLSALVFHPLFVASHGLVIETLPGLDGPAAIGSGLKWGIAVALILPQSMLLGMSFPLLAAGLIRLLPADPGRSLGSLYFSNSMGAAIGALVAVFVLLPLIGLPGAVKFAGLLNLLVGIAAWVLGSRPEDRPIMPRLTKREPTEGQNGKLLPLILAATALSSAASFVYELGWIRMLSLAFGTTLHAFELMLAAFIGGIALGGLWIRSRADRWQEPLRAAGWLQVCMGLAAVGSLAIYADGAFEWVGLLMQSLGRSSGGYAFYNLGTAAAALVIMLPAAFFAGALLPLLTRLLLKEGFGERVIGQVYAWNTLGAIVGVFAALHWLIPMLGLRNAMLSAAAIDLAIGVGLITIADRGRSIHRASAGFAVSVGVLALAIVTIDFDPYRLASGVFRSGNDRLGDDMQMLYYRDGKTASVATYQTLGGTTRFITHNGKVDAALTLDSATPATGDEPTMVLAAALPLALNRDYERAAVIGFGSGLTTHVLLQDARLEQVDTIEIEARMVEGARRFEHRVSAAYDDPRSRVLIDDALSVVAATSQPYDLIVSEPSNPWMAGVGGLFADEFYQFTASRLSADGVFVQWLQLYEINDELVGSVLSALTPHFADFQAWMANDTDLLIMASQKPLGELEAARLFDGDLGRELALADLTDPAQINLRHYGDRRWLLALTRTLNQPANSWYYPRLSLEAPRARFEASRAARLIELAVSPSPAQQLLGLGRPLPSGVEPSGLRHFSPEHRTRDARQKLAQLISGTSSTGRFPEIELIYRRANDCNWLAQPDAQREWLALFDTSLESMLPYLAPEEIERLTGEEWLGCPVPDGPIALAQDLLMALASQQTQQIIAASDAWLRHVANGESSGSLYLSQQAWFSGQAALLSRDDYAGWEDFRLAFIGLVTLTEGTRFLEDVLAQYANILLTDNYLP